MLSKLWNRIFPGRRDVPHAAFSAAQADEPDVRPRRAPIVAHVHADGAVSVDARVAEDVRRRTHPALKAERDARVIAPAAKKKLVATVAKSKKAKKKAPRR